MLNCLKIYQQKKLEEQGVADAEQQIELLEKDETVTTAMSEISQIDAKALPSVISQQFSKITDLEEKVMAYILKRHPEWQAVEVPLLAPFRSALSDFPSYRLLPAHGFGAGGFCCLLKKVK